MRLNTPVKMTVFTHGGALATPVLTPLQQLRRAVLSCFLFEDEFYEDGQEISKRMRDLASKVAPEHVAALAIQARSDFNLRHAPLYLAACLAKPHAQTSLVADTICAVIQRADELAEFLAIYQHVWEIEDGSLKKRMGAQTKKGLARAFQKFNAHALAKYNRDGKIKLRDVLFLCHAKPRDAEQEAVWKQLIDGTLPAPDTWEVALSGGADKRGTFERLIREGRLGYLALLRNLRNMADSGVDMSVVAEAILARKNGAERVLPFRFVAAARACPQMEGAIDEAMLAGLVQQPKLPGRTLVVVDVSGSMWHPLSAKSDMKRVDAACALAAVAREICEMSAIYATAGNDGTRVHATAEVPPRHGMALVDAMQHLRDRIGGGGIFLNQVCRFLRERGVEADRMIVITDEQDCGLGDHDSPRRAVPLGSKSNYLINVASARNGIGYGNGWTHIDGFSEQVIRYIAEAEKMETQAKDAGQHQGVTL